MNDPVNHFWERILAEHLDHHEAGIALTPLDVAIGQFTEAQDPDGGPLVPFVAAILSHASREGQVCLSLNQLASRLRLLQSQYPDIWPGSHGLDTVTLQQALASHPAVLLKDDQETTAFLYLEEDRLYLRRFWTLENEVLTFVQQRQSKAHATFTNGVDPSASKSQQQAIKKALACLGNAQNQRGFFVLTGGPGTGKTWTVARILAALQQQRRQNAQPLLRLAMAAPTGKAAARLKEAIQKNRADFEPFIQTSIPQDVLTLHRLLGASQDGTRFRFHPENPLNVDLLIIDEASMVDLRLMAKTMAALPAHAGLMLVGDKDQLASVEAGSVLADLCFPNAPYLAVLEENHRAKGPLLMLLESLQQNPDSNRLRDLFKPFLQDLNGEAKLQAHVLQKYNDGYFSCFKNVNAPDSTKIATLFQAFNAFQVLCPHREGPYGTVSLNAAIEQSMFKKHNQVWYDGRAIMITRNHYGLGLFNGDIGLTLRIDEQPRVFFETAAGLKDFAPSRLPPYEPAFAITVHKSQGSEFDEVMLVLPNEDLPILTRELVYTAVTRAKEKLSIHGNPQRLEEALARHIDRASGLRKKLQARAGT